MALDPENAQALNDLGVALEQQGDFAKAREMFDRALKLKPGNLYIQQNYDLFREAMTSAIARRSQPRLRSGSGPAAFSHSIASGSPRSWRWGETGCATVVEVPVETPVQSKIDVSRFRRVLVAGFVTDLGENDVELGSETSRLLQNQLRSNSRLQVLEPDHRPSRNALEQAMEKLGEGGKYNKQEKEQYKLETDRVLSDAEYWRKVGEEFQNPLIVTGRVGFRGAEPVRVPVRGARGARSRHQPAAPGARQSLPRAQGFSLSAEFYFIDGRTGQSLHKEKFTEEVLYGEEQKISPLSSYFELMDRLIPNFWVSSRPRRSAARGSSSGSRKENL